MGQLRNYFNIESEYLDVIKYAQLFSGIDAENIGSMLGCLDVEIKRVKKGEILLLAGDKPSHVGILLFGQIHIVKEDLDGKRSLVAALLPSDIFAEALCCAGVEESPVTVIAEADSAAMMMRFDRILRICPSSCSFHAKLIENMIGIIAKKNIMLQGRMDIISVKSVRMKVIRYLEQLVSKQGNEVTIPFNREELADYLCVERSALSHELSKMKKDGLIDYKKNKFYIYRQNGWGNDG